jgi:hypothetical protein
MRLSPSGRRTTSDIVPAGSTTGMLTGGSASLGSESDRD